MEYVTEGDKKLMSELEKCILDTIAMLAFDIDSDSYVFFPCDIAKIKQLEEWAKEEDFRIAYAKEM